MFFFQAIIIQKTVRGWLARRRYAKMRMQVIICQAAVSHFLSLNMSSYACLQESHSFGFFVLKMLL